MVITITTSRPTAEQAAEVDRFLRSFLPRLEIEQPGVVAAYHYSKTDVGGESITVIVWEDNDARLAYRSGNLIGEAMAMEERLGLESVREAYPLTYPLS